MKETADLAWMPSATSATDLDISPEIARKKSTGATVVTAQDTSLGTVNKALMKVHATLAGSLDILQETAQSQGSRRQEVVVVAAVTNPMCLATNVTKLVIWPGTVRPMTSFATTVINPATSAVSATTVPEIDDSLPHHLTSLLLSCK
uniref:Uncharacterized protein n=1 Tax=Cacopsylla melanoneura TaxID=428564 RepID=A0A8D8QPI1_9HEMI